MDSTRTDALIRQAQAGDRAAREALFAHAAPLLRAGLRRMLGERYRRLHGDSDDAAQDALLVAFTQLARYEAGRGGSFLAWLLGIAELEVLQRLRAHGAKKRGGGQVEHLESAGAGAGAGVGEGEPLDPSSGGATPSQVARGHELEERVRAALEQMPRREREVLVLKRYVGLDTAAIAVELQLPSDGAARALLSRAQARLAEMLDLDGG